MDVVTKCTVKEAKFLVKNLVVQRCAEEFNSGAKWLKVSQIKTRLQRWRKGPTINDL
jgi:hypothetical protein